MAMKMNPRDLGKLMKQAQAAQEKVAAAEEELREREFTGTAGGGVVEVVVNGRHQMKSIKIDPQVVRPEDVELLEDLVLTAANEAHRQAEETHRTAMDKLTGDLGLGGMF
jgi:DNA-binding YbaB/EbfC family protein